MQIFQCEIITISATVKSCRKLKQNTVQLWQVCLTLQLYLCILLNHLWKENRIFKYIVSLTFITDVKILFHFFQLMYIFSATDCVTVWMALLTTIHKGTHLTYILMKAKKHGKGLCSSDRAIITIQCMASRLAVTTLCWLSDFKLLKLFKP